MTIQLPSGLLVPNCYGQVMPAGMAGYLPFETDEPQLIVSIDFVQQELAILAGLSKDENLLSCYVGDNKRDVHGLTGGTIINMMQSRRRDWKIVTYDEFMAIYYDKTHEWHKEAQKVRKKYAKTTNFLLVYGGSAAGLSRKVIVPLKMAETFVEAFHASYPRVAKFQEKVIQFGRKYGFVLTAYGNRKHCFGIRSKNKREAAMWERQAINAPIQSTAADVLKLVLRKIVLTRLCEETGATLIAPVYDELVASVPVSKVIEYIERLSKIMSVPIPNTPVVLDTSASIGKNWGEQIELNEMIKPGERLADIPLRELGRRALEKLDLEEYA